MLETQIVAYGNGATTPTDPSREGYTFTGWSEDFSNITEALTVKAQYNINSYQITYEAGANGTLTGGDRTDAKHYGDSYSPAPLPVPNNGYVFSHWTPALPGANDKITESKTFKAIFTLAGGGTSGGGGGGGGGGTTNFDYGQLHLQVVVEPELIGILNREDHYAYMVGYPDTPSTRAK